LQLELTAVTGVDKLHVDILSSHHRCFVSRTALFVLGLPEFLDLTIVPDLVRLGYAKRMRFD
jgi:hypothetical protein